MEGDEKQESAQEDSDVGAQPADEWPRDTRVGPSLAKTLPSDTRSESGSEAAPDSSLDTSLPWFRRVTLFGLLSSLCPLIPLPFVDDWALAWVRRRMVREVLGNAGLQVGPAEVRLLAGEEGRSFWKGCLSSIFLAPLFKIAIYLVRKLIKKILLFLTLKEASDRFSETFHEGYLLHQAAVAGTLGEPQSTVSGAAAATVRGAICQACGEVDPRPFNQLVKRILRGSRSILATTSRSLGRVLRSEKRSSGPRGAEARLETEAELEREEKVLSGLLDRLTSALGHEEGYLIDLEKRYQLAVKAREHSFQEQQESASTEG